MKRNFKKNENRYFAPEMREIGCRIEHGFGKSAGGGITDPIFEDEENFWND